MKYAVNQELVGNTLIVKFSDGSENYYNITDLGCDWFRMTNDSFFDYYGFNFNPHNFEGLYEKCRNLVFGG